MAKFKYNGYTLPGIPDTVTEDFAHKAIVLYNDEFFLYCANAQFSIQIIDGTQTIAFPAGSGCYLYMCKQDSTEWTGGLFEPTEGENSGEWYTIPTYATFIWCTPDIRDADANVVYEASDPVPMFDLNRWLTGFALGLSGKTLQLNEGNPVVPDERPLAYAYNGIPLPPLQWDKKTYPYALMHYSKDRGQFLHCVYKTINYFDFPYAFSTARYFGGNADGTSLVFAYTPGEAGWVQLEYTNWKVIVDKERVLYNNPVLWANFDLMYSDDTLYVGASKPEPITNPEPFEGMYYYNTLVCPNPFSNKYDSHYKDFIVKIGNKYVAFWVFNYLGGGYFGVYGSGLYLYAPDTYAGVYVLDDSGEWKRGELEDYLGEETYEYNGNTYCRICAKGYIVWSEEDMTNIGSSTVAFSGSEPVPVDLTILAPPSDPEPPSSVGTDNDSMLLIKGWLVGRAIASQREKQPTPPVEPDEPSIEPVAYLYGTPSESGNIGLRVGDTVTYYEGALLPKLPGTDLPYSLVHKSESANDYYFIASERAGEVYNTLLSSLGPRIEIGSEYTTHRWKSWILREGATGWEEYRNSDEWYYENFKANTLIWTNCDMYYNDSTTVHEELRGTLYVSASSDPIPVSGIVGYSYNGEELPVLPDRDTAVYPYACIVTSITGKSRKLYLSQVPFYVAYRPNGDLVGALYSVEKPPYLDYSLSDDGTHWEYIGLATPAGTGLLMRQNPVWANTDLKKAVYNYVDADNVTVEFTDEVVFEASEPVPVYE